MLSFWTLQLNVVILITKNTTNVLKIVFILHKGQWEGPRVWSLEDLSIGPVTSLLTGLLGTWVSSPVIGGEVDNSNRIDCVG